MNVKSYCLNIRFVLSYMNIGDHIENGSKARLRWMPAGFHIHSDDVLHPPHLQCHQSLILHRSSPTDPKYHGQRNPTVPLTFFKRNNEFWGELTTEDASERLTVHQMQTQITDAPRLL